VAGAAAAGAAGALRGAATGAIPTVEEPTVEIVWKEAAAAAPIIAPATAHRIRKLFIVDLLFDCSIRTFAMREPNTGRGITSLL
jgi:hypothetical protein